MTDITFCEKKSRFRYKAAAVIIEEGALAFMFWQISRSELP